MQSLKSGTVAHESPRSALGTVRPDPRTIALIAGVLFLVTFVTSIPAVLLYRPVLHDPHYVTSAGSDTRVFLGGFLELLLIIANIGTAVVLFPILKRQSESTALGYVCSDPASSSASGTDCCSAT